MAYPPSDVSTNEYARSSLGPFFPYVLFHSIFPKESILINKKLLLSIDPVQPATAYPPSLVETISFATSIAPPPNI